MFQGSGESTWESAGLELYRRGMEIVTMANIFIVVISKVSDSEFLHRVKFVSNMIRIYDVDVRTI